jgi:hypothetical protein
VFHHFKEESIGVKNISYLVQFSLAVPVSNTAAKNTFSLINDLRSDDRNTLTLETVKAEIIKTHYSGLTCVQFYKLILNEQHFLEEVHPSKKYSTKDKPGHSRSWEV